MYIYFGISIISIAISSNNRL